MRINPEPHVEKPKSIQDMFLESLGDFNKSAQQTNHGDPLFVKTDVLSSRDELTQMLRAICIAKGITKQQLGDVYREYATNVLKESPSRISTGAGNLLSAVKRDPVSFKTFIKLFGCVMGCNVDFTVKITNPDGRIEEFNHLQVLDNIINSVGND